MCIKVYTSSDGNGLQYQQQDCAIEYENTDVAENCYGIIKYFLLINSCIYMVVRQFTRKRFFNINLNFHDHLKQFYNICQLTDNYTIIKESHLKWKCTIIVNNDQNEFFLTPSYDVSVHS